MKSETAKRTNKRLGSSAVLGVLSCVSWFLGFSPFAHAGLYYSGENIAELPAQWRGFLVDQRSLRMLAVKPAPGLPPSPLQKQYRDALASLEKKKNLTADELADLGAIYVRLGQPDKAIELLRPAQRKHPDHFRIAANLGTAWHLNGNLDQAADCLRIGLKFCPPKYRGVEELHLKLIRSRQHRKDSQALDDLLGIHFGTEVGTIADAERKKFDAEVVANMQRLALSLPADGRFLWQLGELANALGEVRTAAGIFDGCVTEFGMSSPPLRQRRQALRAAADKLGPATRTDSARAGHEGHAGLTFRSPHALVRKFDFSTLPAIRDSGPNPLPWAVLAETSFDAKYHPKFVDYLKKLDGKTVSLTGFMQPIGDQFEVSEFLLIEYPVGCWFCETPPPTGLIFVELPTGKTHLIKRGMVKIEGKLKLNATDPEDFLFSLKDARIGEVD